MKQQQILMGMTIGVEIVDPAATTEIFDRIFSYFKYIDETFSPYKATSEITKINQGLIAPADYSADMREVLKLSEETKQLTNGYFDIKMPTGKYDPSGLVKGWAIYQAAKILWQAGFKNFYLDVGGDIQVSGRNRRGELWSIGIRSPFKPETEIVKVLVVADRGVATSGNYVRGGHIYNPHSQSSAVSPIVSLTVVGPNIYEADRFATAAFAMGEAGINFIEQLDGFEGYAIDQGGLATLTSGFDQYVEHDA